MIPIIAYNYGAKRKDRVMEAIKLLGQYQSSENITKENIKIKG